MTTYEATIYVIDDEESMRIAVSQWLGLGDYQVQSFSGAEDALAALTPEFNGVVVTDIRMPGMDGLELMDRALQIDSEIPLVFITAHGDIAMAVSAIQSGAYDFLEKPFEPEILLKTVKRALEKRQLVLENRALRRRLDESSGIEKRLLGTSESIQFLLQEIRDLAPTEASVLLIGETGVGKEVVARCLHQLSRRREGPFVALNCGAIPEMLFESELFGHEAGAFTGALERRIGKFEKAAGGTLFLDEVNSMPPALQVKVLRVLQEKEIERLGSNTAIPVDIRIISSTNTDPRRACATGSLRKDLYYRLNVAELAIPPLRRRGTDIILLFDYFSMLAAERYERDQPSLTPAGIQALMSYDWPGNVRELKNLAERYVLSSLPPRERIAHILQQPETEQPPGETSLATRTAVFERCLIEQSLKRHGGNIGAVLEELDLPRRTLNQKMKNHGLNRTDFLKDDTNDA